MYGDKMICANVMCNKEFIRSRERKKYCSSKCTTEAMRNKYNEKRRLKREAQNPKINNNLREVATKAAAAGMSYGMYVLRNGSG